MRPCDRRSQKTELKSDSPRIFLKRAQEGGQIEEKRVLIFVWHKKLGFRRSTFFQGMPIAVLRTSLHSSDEGESPVNSTPTDPDVKLGPITEHDRGREAYNWLSVHNWTDAIPLINGSANQIKLIDTTVPFHWRVFGEAVAVVRVELRDGDIGSSAKIAPHLLVDAVLFVTQNIHKKFLLLASVHRELARVWDGVDETA